MNISSISHIYIKKYLYTLILSRELSKGEIANVLIKYSAGL
jgi:hypothetical protein